MSEAITAKKPRKKYLSSAKKLRKYLNSLINRYEHKEIETQHFRALCYSIRIMNELLTGAELEERVKALEEKLILKKQINWR